MNFRVALLKYHSLQLWRCYLIQLWHNETQLQLPQSLHSPTLWESQYSLPAQSYLLMRHVSSLVINFKFFFQPPESPCLRNLTVCLDQSLTSALGNCPSQNPHTPNSHPPPPPSPKFPSKYVHAQTTNHCTHSLTCLLRMGLMGGLATSTVILFGDMDMGPADWGASGAVGAAWAERGSMAGVLGLNIKFFWGRRLSSSLPFSKPPPPDIHGLITIKVRPPRLKKNKVFYSKDRFLSLKWVENWGKWCFGVLK